MSANAQKNGKLRKVKSILISQPEPTNGKSPYFDLSQKHKVKIDFRKFIQIEAVTAKEFRKSKIYPDQYDIVILTSRNAITYFFKLCEALRIQMSPDTKYICSSEAIALYLQKFIEYRKRKVFYPKNANTTIYDLFNKHKDAGKFLYPCADIHKSEIPDYLSEKGFEFAEAVIYKIISSDLSDLADIYYDVIAFFTPLGIKSLFDNFPDFEQKNTRIAAFGNVTSQAVENADLEVNIQAPAPGTPSMAMALEQYIVKANK